LKLQVINKIKKRIKYYFRKNKQISLVFLCNRPAVWGSLKTVLESCVKDNHFNVTFIAMPSKKQLPEIVFNHDIYESEGAENFFKNLPCKVINGYDYERKTWFDIKKLKPNYIFYQRPYNATIPPQYNSKVTSSYAKILYVPYFTNFIGGCVFESCYNHDFFRHTYQIFIDSIYSKKELDRWFSTLRKKPETIVTGYPKYDNIDKLKDIDSDNWNFPKTKNVKRVIWTPRWCTDEGNCHFFDYKDKLLDFVEKSNDIDFIFRPHPQAFLEWNATGELPEVEAEKYKEKYNILPNAKIDTQKEYLTTFYSSDIMISDMSSVVAEYFLTGKPIIYCHKKDCFNDFSRALSEGFYWVHNWEELEKTINMLKCGNDPLKEKRQEIIEREFYLPKQGAGFTIKELIKRDFYG
jgi:hypothetical protein